jgi:hypothetical protein
MNHNPGRILPSPTKAERRHEERHDEFKGEDRVPPNPIWSDVDRDDLDDVDDDSRWDGDAMEEV